MRSLMRSAISAANRRSAFWTMSQDNSEAMCKAMEDASGEADMNNAVNNCDSLPHGMRRCAECGTPFYSADKRIKWCDKHHSKHHL